MRASASCLTSRSCKRAEGALGAIARLRGRGRDMLDPELGQRPLDLGRLLAARPGRRRPGCGSSARRGRCRARQNWPCRGIVSARPRKLEAVPCSGDQEGGIDRGGRVVDGDDQVERRLRRRARHASSRGGAAASPASVGAAAGAGARRAAAPCAPVPPHAAPAGYRPPRQGKTHQGAAAGGNAPVPYTDRGG